MSDKPVIIIGSGHAGVQAAARLAELRWDGGIVLVDQEETAPYERPPLSKEMLKSADPTALSLLRKDTFYRDNNIERISGRPVRTIDRAARQIELAGGVRHSYHRLIIATGSTPRRLDVPGADLPGVHTLSSHADALALQKALTAGSRVTIVGAGYIGLEVAAAAAARGCDVTIVEFRDRVLSRVTSEIVSRHFESLHRSNGARFVFGAGVRAFEGDGRVQRVVTSDGTSLDTDIVVVGVGVVPNQQLAADAGIACDDGILVNPHCQTSDPEVYAIGDVARCLRDGEPRGQRLESVQNAVAQAITATNHVVSQSCEVKTEVPWFWTVQHGTRLQTAGLRHESDDIVVRGSALAGKFSVLYLREGRLAAIDTVDALKDFVPAKKLIAAGAALDPARAADPSIKLAQSQTDIAQ
ncbi:FAD-dependent oxidoreductase [Rhodococcus pseudokoreensis]|uniref:FAD-dependent oxidoreductase n=1 Tax=Rhodococcus pseudokoreensis TaxID=2811421 RepID=A0A974W961_9NOCA|nr:FAD-dependent oxidoreductase [Rhodococcus pseudokoreensis]QSE92568.1 FAD-dependent oxidoreductase [Rhodococcus pseudokoreensis]